jgi:hypothetical protein
VDPVVELVDDPGQLAGRRIGQAIGDRLWPGGVHLEVAVPLPKEGIHAADAILLHVGERRQLGVVDPAVRNESDRRRVQMNADDVLGIGVTELGREHRAQVAALRPVSLVADAVHELGPRPCRASRRPARLGQWSREAESRERGDDEMERIGRIAAMRARVGEGLDDIEEFGDGAGKTVRHHQRQRIGFFRAGVHEMDVLTVDRRRELRYRVEPGLLRAPVVCGAPVVDEVLEVGDRYATAPTDVGQLGGPARVSEPIAKVVEVAIGHFDAKWANLVVTANVSPRSRVRRWLGGHSMVLQGCGVVVNGRV